MNGYAIYAISALAVPLVVAIAGYFIASGFIPGYGRTFSTKTRAYTTAANGSQVSEGTAPALQGRVFATNIPVRLDHLPWSRFHTRIVIAVSATWCLAGWMVTLVGPLDPVLHLALPRPE